MLEKAIQIASEAHIGQVDKAGQPYILHLIRVMNAGQTESEKICGVLHDLVEDTHWTFADLKKEGFSEEILNALQCVTKEVGEDYEHFIARVKGNLLAVRVKLNDLKDNMDITRLSSIREENMKRLNKYLKAYHSLLEEEEE